MKSHISYSIPRISCLVFLFFTFHFSLIFAQTKSDTVPRFMADSLNTVYIFADKSTTINKVDAEGRKQGLWKKYYLNGNLRYEGHFIDNLPFGIFKNYYENDSLEAIRVYAGDGKTAYVHIFYTTGALEGQGKIIDEKNDSIWKFYDEWQRLIVKEQYKNGLLDGKYITFYSDGRVAEILTYKDGLKNGPWLQYFINGQLKLEGTLADGEMQDTLYVYFPNGYMHIKGKYVDDLKEGDWIYYNANGYPKDTIQYHGSVMLHPEKYGMTKAQEDSAIRFYQPLQQQLDNPGSLEQQYQMGNEPGQ